MKKLLFSILIAGASSLILAQTTATNFTCNDCQGNPHTLFDELDAGTVVVICWVMPCATCINPAATAATTVQGFASSHPGRVKYYMVDDYANSTCSTINNWAATNSITYDASFSCAAIKMTDYGTNGMPKTVVLGGSNHSVFFNVNGNISASALQTAINNALNAGTGIAETENDLSSFSVFPNPAVNSTAISYTLSHSAEIKVEVFNMVGEKVKTILSTKQTPGEYKLDIDCSKFNSGIYFVKLSAGKREKTVMLSVSR